MLADAVAAEFYKVLRQRGGLFWGFCAVPLGVLLFHLVFDTWIGSRVRLTLMVDLGSQILDGLKGGGSTFFHIFFIAGAVAIFSGEYRWETWRLLTPRNSRANLLAAKVIVYAVASGVSLLALGLAYAVHAAYAAILNGATLILPDAGFAVRAAAIFLVSWAELLLLGLFAGLVAVSTRAMVGPLIAAICFSFAQQMALIFLGPADAALRWFAAFPGMSAWYVRAWITNEQILPGIFPDAGRAVPAALFLAAWIGLLGAAALVRFQRQDLTRE